MSSAPTRVIVDDAEAAARATADLLIHAALQSVKERGVFHLCATGGSTPAALYAVLRDPAHVTRMPWSSTQIWFGDDRHVPRSSPLSNLVSVDALLLAPASSGEGAPSFSLGLLPAARAVCATVVGAGKREAIARILEGEGDVRDLPAKAALLPTATWIIDRAAAADLHRATER